MSAERWPWLPIARWELSRIITRPDFILSVVLTPLIAFGLSFGMGMINKNRVHRVAVVRVDDAGRLTARGEAALPPLSNTRWLDPGAAGADSVALAAALRSKTFDAALLLPADLGGEGVEARLMTRRDPPLWTRSLESHVAAARLRERAASLGLDSAQTASLQSKVVWQRQSVAAEGQTDRRATRIVMLTILLLMSTVLLTSISYVMVGISGEKTARVTEVVISAVSAQSWMDGKIIAFTVIGLIVGVVWAASLMLVAGPLSFAMPGRVDPAYLTITLFYALLGLLLYNAFIAALMASAQNMQTASRWQGNFIMLPFIPLAFLGAMMDAPDALWVTIVSHIPFFSPIMIPARLAMDVVPVWECAVGLVVLVASVGFMRQVAGRVFRIGMLMYGKDMTLPELIRWARVK